ncbi:MAG: hypothetical protein LBI19_00740 [Oscillospiraceae bacterium]|jgi:hypothetical protein|nr:hypothetical protein [Oscillospiraceae bacterium]
MSKQVRVSAFSVLLAILLLASCASEPQPLSGPSPDETVEASPSLEESPAPPASEETALLSPDQPVPPEPSHAVYLPPVTLPVSIYGFMLSYTSRFVYEGRVYVISSWRGSFYNDDESLKQLIGEWLGTLDGNMEDWPAEFTGNAIGDLYSVKGYRNDFRLCVYVEYADEDGTNRYSLAFYEHLNDIGLTAGADLYGDRLHLRERWSALKYQTLSNRKGEAEGLSSAVYHDLGISDVVISAFIDTLYAAPFEFYKAPGKESSEEEVIAYEAFIRERERMESAYLIFYMNDGMDFYLQFYEDGLVQYRCPEMGLNEDITGGYGMLFVRMSGESFDTVNNVCFY